MTDCLEHGTLECPDELLYCTGAVTINKIDNKDETSISLLGWSDSRPDSVVSEFVFASSLNGYPVSGEKGFFQGLRAYNVVFAPQPEGGGFVSTDNEAFLNNPWIQTVDLTCTRLVERLYQPDRKGCFRQSGGYHRGLCFR